MASGEVRDRTLATAMEPMTTPRTEWAPWCRAAMVVAISGVR